MAVIGNTASEIGDVILFDTSYHIIGVSSLTGWSDDVVGETGTRYFYREFRYYNGLITSSWLELTTANVQSVSIDKTMPLFIEYRYIRAGTDDTGLLEFNHVIINGVYEGMPCSDLFNNSFLAQLISCDDPNIASWCSNVLNKLYERGIVPDYLVRNENGNADGEDDDYISLFKTISCFFAAIVAYTRKFEDIRSDKRLAVPYLNEFNMHVVEGISLSELDYIISKLYNEMMKRGTIDIIYDRSKHDVPDTVDGELLRTIGYNSSLDEFLFTLMRPEHTQWVMDQGSPLFRGTYSDTMLIKAYNESKDITDLSEFPLDDESYISLLADEDLPDEHGGTGTVMEISAVPAGEDSGIKASLLYGSILIDDKVSYEITFFIKFEGDVSPIGFGVLGYDQSGVGIIWENPDGVPETEGNSFLDGWSFPVSDKWVFVRGIIYGKNVQNILKTYNRINVGFGNLMRFPDSGTIKIAPYLIVDNTSGSSDTGTVKIWDFKVRPLMMPDSPFSIESENKIVIWAKNNNPEFIEEEQALTVGHHEIQGNRFLYFPLLWDFMRIYLLPYNSHLMVNWLNE